MKKFRHQCRFLISLAMLLSIGCSKKNELEKARDVVEFKVTLYSVDLEAVYKVYCNDDLVTDNMFHGEIATKVVAKEPEAQHITVLDRNSGKTVIDTMINITEKKYFLSMVQLEQGKGPRILSGDASNIPDGYKMLSFYYSSDLLPDEISLNIYVAHYNEAWEFERADTVHYERVKKGELSAYKLIKDETAKPDVIYYIQVLDIATKTELPALAAKFDPVMGTGYNPDMGPGSTGTEKFYINSIVPIGSVSFMDIFSNRIVSY